MSSIPPTYNTYHQSAVSAANKRSVVNCNQLVNFPLCAQQHSLIQVIVVTAMSGTLLLCILVFLSLFSDNPSAVSAVNERGKVERNLVFTNSSMSSATFATQVLVLALVFGTVLLFNFVFALSDTICRFLGCQHGNE